MQTCTSKNLKYAFASKRTTGQVLSYMNTYATSCHLQLAKTAASLAKHHTNHLANGPFRESTQSFQALHASIRFLTNANFQQQMPWLCKKVRIVLRAAIQGRTKPFIAEDVAFNELSLEQHTTQHGSIEHNHGYWARQTQMLWRVQHKNGVCALCGTTLNNTDTLASLRQRDFLDASMLLSWGFKCLVPHFHCMQLTQEIVLFTK